MLGGFAAEMKRICMEGKCRQTRIVSTDVNWSDTSNHDDIVVNELTNCEPDHKSDSLVISPTTASQVPTICHSQRVNL